MTDYKVTSGPTFCDDGEAAFTLGDLVHVDDSIPDSDGDVHAYRGSDPDEWNYIALKCLTPVDNVPEPVAPRNDIERVSVRALRAALSMADVPASDIDDLIRVIQIIDTAYID